MNIMNKKHKKPFIPRDLPKSAIVLIIVSLTALLIAGPMMFGGIYLELNWLLQIGRTLFTLCVFTFFLMFVIFNINRSKGKHQNIRECDWKNQVW